MCSLRCAEANTIPDRDQPDQLCRLVAAESVTPSHCVPTILDMMLSDAGAEAVHFTGRNVLIGCAGDA